MGQSSTLWVTAGFVALLIIGYFRDRGLTLSGRFSRRKEFAMKKAQETVRVLVFGALNTIWAIGASVMAGHLLA